MKLLRVEVEHFACITNAAVDLGPGLNVLFGPNDLGKSTLARAIRAGLLIQHASATANEFHAWDGGEFPAVKVTLELPDRRIWRVEKRFGSPGGSSVLRESTDGETFHRYKKAREVDEEIRSKLGWGIASPATKNAPRGLPTSFLATVLLGDQADVAGVLTQTLEADTDESGRALLTAALAAFAQDPLFKTVLDEAQKKVDQAFTTTGRRKGGKSSPFREATDAVKRAKDALESLTQLVDKSENERRQLEAHNEDLLRRQEARELARERRKRLDADATLLETRRKIEEELLAATKVLEEHQAQVAELANRESQLQDTETALKHAESKHDSLTAARTNLQTREKAAEEAVRRAKSDDAEQARELRRKEVEKRLVELESESKELASEREKVTKSREMTAELTDSERSLSELEKEREKGSRAALEAETSRRDTASQIELLEVAGLVAEESRGQADIDRLEGVLDQAAADRAKANQHRSRAAELQATIEKDLPEPSALDAAQELAHELEIAEAALGGGLSVIVNRLQTVALETRVDGHELELSSEDTVSFDAGRGFELQIGDFAQVSVTAGERDAREKRVALGHRWEAEVVPLLERLEAPSIEALAERVRKASELKAQIEEIVRAATDLEKGAAVREEQLSRLETLREEQVARVKALKGRSLDEAKAVVEEHRGPQLAARLTEVKRQLTEAENAYGEAQRRMRDIDTECRVLAERVETTRGRLEESGVQEPESGWDRHEAQLSERAEQFRGEMDRIAKELEELDAEQNAEVEKTTSALALVQEQLAQADSKLAEAAKELESLRVQKGRFEGEIKTRRATVDRIDTEASAGKVEDVSSLLDKLPETLREITNEEVRRAKKALETAEREYEHAKDEARKAEGALERGGGQVVLEQQDAAKDALSQAEQKEHDVELEFDAWQLLVSKLREAENTEGQHIGEALSKPITDRFTELTANKYGKLEVAPNLQAEGLEVSGQRRNVRDLSVGTQEQLATLLRLTVAEHLESTLVLDDQLTQTDPARSDWFRDVLREHAMKAQVVVLTCRPLHYLLEADMPGPDETYAKRAAGLIQAVDLSRVIR